MRVSTSKRLTKTSPYTLTVELLRERLTLTVTRDDELDAVDALMWYVQKLQPSRVVGAYQEKHSWWLTV